MKFKRMERYEPVVMTARKLGNAARRVVKQCTQLASDYPLFSDQLEQPAPFDADHELKKRQKLQEAAETRMRAAQAKHWRQARRDYFQATPEQRIAIMAAWNTWRGPLRASNFQYLVDVHNGTMDARSRKFREEQAATARRIASLPSPLSLGFCLP
ncbi:MAG: hypothetical protein RR800_00515 [Comamonas sp.]